MGGAGADIATTRLIAGYILVKDKDRVLASELTRDVRPCRGQPMEKIRDLVSPLVAGGWLDPDDDLNPRGWLVNATVHQQFAGRKKQQVAARAATRDLILGAPAP